jgi:hypothetical protein
MLARGLNGLEEAVVAVVVVVRRVTVAIASGVGVVVVARGGGVAVVARVVGREGCGA